MQKRKQRVKLYTPREGEEWICAKCGRHIESLPFIPSKGRPIYHRECIPPRK